jgi:hypothetical protein
MILGLSLDARKVECDRRRTAKFDPIESRGSKRMQPRRTLSAGNGVTIRSLGKTLR